MEGTLILAAAVLACSTVAVKLICEANRRGRLRSVSEELREYQDLQRTMKATLLDEQRARARLGQLTREHSRLMTRLSRARRAIEDLQQEEAGREREQETQARLRKVAR